MNSPDSVHWYRTHQRQELKADVEQEFFLRMLDLLSTVC